MSRFTIIVPGYFAQASEYSSLERLLNKQNISTVTVPLSKLDWLPTVGGRSMLPILKKVDATVKKMLEKYPQAGLNIIGHSAGGWIARIYLGREPYDVHGDISASEAVWPLSKQIKTLITLGTPHRSLEYWTRKNLNFVNDNYPGAFYPEIKYVCVAGKSILGDIKLGKWLAYNSYKLTCGQGNCWGDGITPIESAHLVGAVNLVCEGVRHAPSQNHLWYGSAEILQQWIDYLE